MIAQAFESMPAQRPNPAPLSWKLPFASLGTAAGGADDVDASALKLNGPFRFRYQPSGLCQVNPAPPGETRVAPSRRRGSTIALPPLIVERGTSLRKEGELADPPASV